MNNRYKIEVKDPLLRPGLIITTEVSERYVLSVLKTIMEIVRQFNKGEGVPKKRRRK